MEKNTETKKLGPLALGGIFMAYFCSITAVPAGALVGQGADFITGLGGIFLGFVIGAAMITLSTAIGYKTGLKKDAVWKQMFGRQGFKILSFAVAFCMAFSAAFDLYNAARAVYNIVPDGFRTIGFTVAILLILAITIIGGVSGITGVEIISNVSIPVAVILFAIIYVVSVRHAGGLAGLMAYQPVEANYPATVAAQAMVGMWMAGYLGAIDLTTEAKNMKAVIFASVCGSGFVFLCFLVGQVGFMGTGFHTLADICASLGGAIFLIGSIFIMIAQGNTTPACNYMYSNSFAAVFNMKRKYFATGIPLVAAVVAFVIMYGPGAGYMTAIINVVGAIMAPLVAVMLSDFYIVRRGKLEIREEEDLPVINFAPIITIVFGLVISFLLKLVPSFQLSTFFVFGLTFIVYGFVGSLAKNRSVRRVQAISFEKN